MIFNMYGEPVGYSQEERQKALEVSLTSLATSLGYTPVRAGNHYSLKEFDSLIIYNDKSWNRWSGKGNINSGSQIDFLLEFGNIKTPVEAIKYLLEYGGHDTSQNFDNRSKADDMSKNDRVLELPPKNDNYRRVYAYLMKTRGISQETVSEFVHRKLIYEDSIHHNVVFVGYSPSGDAKYAGMRGTADLYGRKFKCDVPGNDKNYGVNIVNKNSSEIVVFESVIDCMSWLDIYGGAYKEWPNLLVLGMVEDNPLEQFLKDYEHINSIRFCLDNDEAAKKSLYGQKESDGSIKKIGLLEKYENKGYRVNVTIPAYGKDFNETLLEMKKKRLEQINNNTHKKGR